MALVEEALLYISGRAVVKMIYDDADTIGTRENVYGKVAQFVFNAPAGRGFSIKVKKGGRIKESHTLTAGQTMTSHINSPDRYYASDLQVSLRHGR